MGLLGIIDNKNTRYPLCRTRIGEWVATPEEVFDLAGPTIFVLHKSQRGLGAECDYNAFHYFVEGLAVGEDENPQRMIEPSYRPYFDLACQYKDNVEGIILTSGGDVSTAEVSMAIQRLLESNRKGLADRVMGLPSRHLVKALRSISSAEIEELIVGLFTPIKEVVLRFLTACECASWFDSSGMRFTGFEADVVKQLRSTERASWSFSREVDVLRRRYKEAIPNLQVDISELPSTFDEAFERLRIQPTDELLLLKQICGVLTGW